jgi:membrane protein YdbS with pleckstrin-like domain
MTKKYYADTDGVNSLRLIIFIGFTVCVLSLYLLFLWLHRTYPEYFRIDITTVPEVMIIAAGVLLTIIYAVFAGIILPKWFASARYAVSFEIICAETGVIIRSNRRMMMSAVQYITSLRFLRFNVVMIHASGGRMIIPFLSDADTADFIKKAENLLTNRGGL